MMLADELSDDDSKESDCEEEVKPNKIIQSTLDFTVI